MLPLVLAGAAFVGAAISRRLDSDCLIEDNLEKAFDPSNSPRDRQKAYQKAMEVNENRYNGESFADVDRSEIDFNKWVEEQKKNQPKQRAQAIEQYANNARLSLKSKLDKEDINPNDYEVQMRQITAWQRSMEKK